MMKVNEFIEKLKACPTTGGFGYYYEDILKLTEDYMLESGDESLKECFKGFISKAAAQDEAKEIIDESFDRLQNFIGLLDHLDDSYYRLNDSGYLENITECDLDNLIEDILFIVEDDDYEKNNEETP